MPKRARRWYGSQGAPRRKIRQQQRKTATERGYGSTWARYSRNRLARQPECVGCGDPARVTDHIVPVTGPDDPRFWDPENHQSLCIPCHSVKTTKETAEGRNGAAIGRENYQRKRKA
jgi:5-methylcytosine-specific restriction endonuclease McrA